MIRYLLDTNVLVDILRGTNKTLKKRFQAIGIDHCVVSDISVYELYCGAKASSRPEKNREILEKVFERLPVIPSSDAYWKAAEEKQRLAAIGTPIEDFDLLIGCTALEYGLTLVTGNVRHMSRIKDLRIEAWG